MAMNRARPWRSSPTMRPNMKGMAAETSSMAKIDRMFDQCDGVLEGMGGIGVEEAAAIGAKLLDCLLAGHRTQCDHLLGALERGGIDRALAGSAASPAPQRRWR